VQKDKLRIRIVKLEKTVARLSKTVDNLRRPSPRELHAHIAKVEKKLRAHRKRHHMSSPYLEAQNRLDRIWSGTSDNSIQ